MDFINNLGSSNVLMFNNQAGGGHKTVVEALQGQIQANGGKVVTKDIINDTLGKPLGNHLYAFYNEAMKAENLDRLKLPLKMQPIGEFFMGIPALFKIVHMLLSNNIQAIVNPQPVILHTITKAARLANFINKYILKNENRVMVYNVLTELPTQDTSDFFRTYKRLSKSDRAVCKLVTIKPLIENATHTENDFWKKHTGFSIDANEIIYDDLPLRKPFLEMASKAPAEIQSVAIELKTDAAKQLLEENHVFDTPLNKGTNSFDIQEKDSVHAIMLGSQAGVASTLHYVKDFIELNRDNTSDEKRYLFVFCADHSKKGSLFEQTCKLVNDEKQKGNYPNNLVIVPLEGQKAEQVAPIIRKSEKTITRSGGLTAMELFAVAKGQIFIHSSKEDVMQGMPEWEAGNVHYLQANKGAKVITTQTSLKQLQAA